MPPERTQVVTAPPKPEGPITPPNNALYMRQTIRQAQKDGFQNLAVVCGACKPAMLDFTRTMALELAEHRIRVDAIAPDYAVTPGLRGNHAGPVAPAGTGTATTAGASRSSS